MVQIHWPEQMYLPVQMYWPVQMHWLEQQVLAVRNKTVDPGSYA
jgi:hypothetical protein